MGQMTQMAIENWQRKSGIEPATGARADVLTQIQKECLELIRVCELERSGIRDGDGYWHGGDVLGGLMDNLNRAHAEYLVQAFPPDSPRTVDRNSRLDPDCASMTGDDRKASLLKHYAGKEPNKFVQIDCWLNGDDIVGRDRHGYGMTGGTTYELMGGGDVRILFKPGLKDDEAVDLLHKAIRWIYDGAMKRLNDDTVIPF